MREYKMLEAKILQKQGMKISKIAEQLQVDRRTVYNYVHDRVFVAKNKQGRSSGSVKLKPYFGYIEAKLQDDIFFNSEILFNQLLRQGYTGKRSILKKHLKERRDEIRKIAVLRFETMPGNQAQVDWADLGAFWKADKLKKRYLFLMKLGYSRKSYMEVTESMEQSVLLACHKRAFNYFGGVPAEILYDNMKTAFLFDTDKHQWKPNPRLLLFANHYGFIPKRCRVRRPQTKGKVEREVRYARSSFLPQINNLRYRQSDELNDLLHIWLKRVDEKILNEFGQTRNERFVEDLKMLQSIPDNYFDHRQPEPLNVSREGTFTYKTNRYSVNAKYIGKALTGLRDPDTGEIAIFNEGTYIKTITLLPDGSRGKVIDPRDRESLEKAWEKGRDEELRRANGNAQKLKEKAKQENIIQHPSIYDEVFGISAFNHEEVYV